MILDSRLEFADGQTLTATGASTNVIDLEDVPRDIGPGRPVYVVINVEDASAASGAITASLAVQTSADEAFTAPVVLASVTIPDGSENKFFVLGFPYENLRFLRLNATISGTTPSLKFSAWLTDQEPVSWKAYKAPNQAV